MLAALAFVAIRVLLAAPAAAPLEIPRPEGFVMDRAALLPATDLAELEARLREWRAATGHDLAVLTLPDLGGQEIEDIGHRVAQEWKLGSKERSDGALLLVAVKEHKVRIEVLRGLEGDLPDTLCGRIIDSEIVPRFKAKDFAGGIRAGVEGIIAAIGGMPTPAVVQHHAVKRRSSGAPLAFFPVVLFLIIALARTASRGRAGPFGRRRRSGCFSPAMMGAGMYGMSGMSGGGLRGGGFGGGFGGGGGGGGGGGFGGFGGGGSSAGGGATGSW